MTDLSLTITPKSDQLNADDLIAGPMTIRITKVTACPGSAEQPIAIYFDGDNGKPYKPCKSMRRVLVQVWGKDGMSYVGRRMTLYRDQNVMFGGVAVGGIRISHMSDIDSAVTLALTATRASRKPYTVQVLPDSAPIGERLAKAKTALENAKTPVQLEGIWKKSATLRADLSTDGLNVLTMAYDARKGELVPEATHSEPEPPSTEPPTVESLRAQVESVKEELRGKNTLAGVAQVRKATLGLAGDLAKVDATLLDDLNAAFQQRIDELEAGK